MTRAGLDKQPSDVASMFDDVAAKYDLTNTVLTGGLDHRWRRQVFRIVEARPGERVLDIAAGTGTSSTPYADAGIDVVPADFSAGMLREGRRRRPDLAFTAADAMALPFADDSFDVVTMSFGLRNVADPLVAMREFLRVAKPGGRVVIAEFSRPTSALLRTAYDGVALRALPLIARKVSSDPESYVYLAETIRSWPAQPELAAQLREAGWRDVEWTDLSGGIVAVHRGSKAPAAASDSASPQAPVG